MTDGETRAALAAVRALGRSGHTVYVVSAQRGSLAAASRHASGEHVLAVPLSDPEKWADGLEQVTHRLAAKLVLPLTEVSLGNIYAYHLEDRLPVACPARDAYQAATDKHALLRRAESLGIGVPRSALIEDPVALSGPPEPFQYPVVLKPRRSRTLVNGRWRAGEARVLHGPDEWGRATRDPEVPGGLLVQEFVPGHGEAVFVLASKGRTLVRFAHRRLREKPPTGGVSVLRESIRPDPELLAGSERLVADLGWTGVAMIEFRRAPDRRAVLMEINPRLWGSLQLAIDAGVDFPSLLVALHRGEAIPQIEPRIGVRTRWLLGDLDHLLISLRRREVRELTGKRVPGLLADFLRSFSDGSRLEILRPDDWRPFLRELRDWRP